MPLEAPRIEHGRPMFIAGLAERHSGTTAGIPTQWRRFAPHIGKVPGQVGQTSYGVVFDSLPGKCSFGYLAGVEVSGVANLPKNYCHLEIPARRYAVFCHEGHVSTLAHTVIAIRDEWLPASGHQWETDGVDFLERYGEAFDPRTGRDGIEVWIPIKS